MLAGFWGIEWLFWWQIPLLFILMVGVWLPAWLFGGGALLYAGARYIAKIPTVTYWRCVAAAAVGGAVGGSIILPAAGVALWLGGFVPGMGLVLLALAGAYLLAAAISAPLLRTTFARSLLAWVLPALVTLLPFLAVVAAILAAV